MCMEKMGGKGKNGQKCRFLRRILKRTKYKSKKRQASYSVKNTRMITKWEGRRMGRPRNEDEGE